MISVLPTSTLVRTVCRPSAERVAPDTISTQPAPSLERAVRAPSAERRAPSAVRHHPLGGSYAPPLYPQALRAPAHAVARADDIIAERRAPSAERVVTDTVPYFIMFAIHTSRGQTCISNNQHVSSSQTTVSDSQDSHKHVEDKQYV